MNLVLLRKRRRRINRKHRFLIKKRLRERIMSNRVQQLDVCLVLYTGL